MKSTKVKTNQLRISRQTINRLNKKAMNQVKGADFANTTGNDLSAIMFNCYTGCTPTFPPGTVTIGYCPTFGGAAL
jgi:hypothetical protein